MPTDDITSAQDRAPWTAESIGRFWDHHSGLPVDDYFSAAVGDGIVHFLRLHDRLPYKEVLDFGCGTGGLLAALLAAGIRCEGVDVSPESVAMVNERFLGDEAWRGASLAGPGVPLPDGSMSLVTCVEVVEHLLDDDLHFALREIHRVLRPGGHLLLTTPHNENLADRTIYCPFCDTSFHRMQHVRSFTKAVLHDLLHGAGFRVELCDNVDLNRFQVAAHPPAPSGRFDAMRALRTARWLGRWAWSLSRGNSLRAVTRPGPHLVALAAKPTGR